MNIAKIMIPKISTVFLHEKDTIRQGLERFMVHGYTAVPVLNDQEQYIGSVTEGDFLRHASCLPDNRLESTGGIPTWQHCSQKFLPCVTNRCRFRAGCNFNAESEFCPHR